MRAASPVPDIAQLWAVAGVALLFASAVWRLAARGLDTVLGGMAPGEWVGLVLITAAFVYGEGVRAIQRKYVPFLIRRIERLADERSSGYRLLAPLYAMALIGSPPRVFAGAWAGVAAIAGAVAIVSRLPHPWRGITDFAVAAALAWACIALLFASWHALRPADREGQ